MLADIHPSNFGVDEHDKMVLMDFGAIAMLPEAFAVPNVASISAISSCLLARNSA